MSAADRTKELVLLMTQNQRRIFSYIYTLVPDRHAAEDILQETSLIVPPSPSRASGTRRASAPPPPPHGRIAS